jgi:hypothetical protein
MDRATHKDSMKFYFVFLIFIQNSTNFGIPPSFLKFKRIEKKEKKRNPVAGPVLARKPAANGPRGLGRCLPPGARPTAAMAATGRRPGRASSAGGKAGSQGRRGDEG